MGTATPTSASRVTISGSAAAAASLFTVTRTTCEPAAASAATWSAVARASAVSVFVIDWTAIECADPTGTEPTSAVTVVLRVAKGTAGHRSGRQRKSKREAPRASKGGHRTFQAVHHARRVVCAEPSGGRRQWTRGKGPY